MFYMPGTMSALYSCMHACIQYSLSAYYVPGTVIGTVEMAVNKTAKHTALIKLIL